MSDPTTEHKIVYVRGLHLYTGHHLLGDIDVVLCPNCKQQFEAEDAHMAWAWQVAPDEEVIGPLCPACAERLADQIEVDNTLVFVARGNGILHFEPLAQRSEEEPIRPQEEALLALYGQKHPDIRLMFGPEIEMLGVSIEGNDIEPPFERADCAACGATFEQAPFATAGAYYGLERLGDLCPKCLDEGPLHWPAWEDVVEASESMGEVSEDEEPTTYLAIALPD